MPPSLRDEFTKKTKEIIAHRAGYRCSKPDCGKFTRGPASDDDGTINLGVAAHITAASSGGPRYNPKLTKEDRKHHSNGIWLCGTHGKLVDSDEFHFTIKKLLKWKKRAESISFREVGESKSSPRGALLEDDDVQAVFDLLLDYSKSDLAAFRQSPGWPSHLVTLNLRVLDGESMTPFTVSGLSSAIDLYDQVAVIAAPGTGKTTTLLQLTEATLANAASVAVFIPLSEWATGSDRLFQSLLKRVAFRDASEPQLELLARHGKLVLVLDGWNELDEASKRRVRNELKALRRDFPDIRVVISSRHRDLDIPINGPVVEVDLLTEEQQLEIAKSLRGPDGESLMDHAWRTSGLRELVAIPLYLTALLKQAPGGSLPKTKEEVLRFFVAELEQDRDKLATLRQALQGVHRKFLEGIAVEATKSETVTLSEEEARVAVNSVQDRLKAENQIAELLQPMNVLDALVDAHMLVRSGTEVGGVSFQHQHQQFQEWFASFHVEQVMLSAALGDDDVRKTLRESILDIRVWEEAILFACDRLSRANEAGARAVAHAILETLGIDPLLSADMIWRSSDDVWGQIRDDVLSFVAKWHTPGSVDRAVKFMIYTGRAEFSEFVWPLVSHADGRVHLHALRAGRRLRCGVLGPDAAERIATLPDDVRGNIISEIASFGGMDAIELAVSLAKVDPDSKIRQSAIESLVFRRADRFAKEILESAPDEVWQALASKWRAREFSDPEVSARIQQEADRLFAEETNPGRILNRILDANVHDPNVAHKVHELVERIDFSAKDNGWVIHRAYELYPQEVVVALLALLEQSKPVPYRADEMLRMSDVLIDEGPLADCVLNHADDGSTATNAVSVVGPKTVGALIDKIFAVYSRIRANDRCDESLSDEYHRLIDLVSSARTDPFIQAVLERANTEDPEEIYSLTNLISRHGRRVESKQLTLAPETHEQVTAAVKRWAGILLVSPEATRTQFAKIAQAAERLESPELVPVLLTLLSEDLKRRKRAREEWLEARRQGRHIQNDVYMCWTPQYRRAFAAIGDQHTIDAMKNYLRDPEFGFDAAHVLKAVWRETQPPQDESGLLKLWTDFSVVPEEYRKRRSATTEETHPFVDDIIAAINALIEPGAPEADLLHALKLATVAFSMPYAGKQEIRDALLQLSVSVTQKQHLLTVLVLSGEVISSEIVLSGIDRLLKETNMTQEQNRWRLQAWLSLLPFTERSSAILEVLDRAEGFQPVPWNLRVVLSALAHSPFTEADTVLKELAKRDERFLGEYDWLAALMRHNTLSAKRFLLDLICSASFAEQRGGLDRSNLGGKLSALMSSDDDFRQDVYERFATLDDGPAASVLEYAIVEAADTDGVLLLTRQGAARKKRFQSTALSMALRNMFIGHTPVEPSGMQSLYSRSASGLRKCLFDLVTSGDVAEARLATECLRVIDEIRDNYGDVESERRHPDITTDVPWPKLDVESAD